MLYAKDFPRMKEFYANMLRANPVNTDWTDSWAFFDTGFALHAIRDEHARNGDISSPPDAREKVPVKLIFTVEDVQAERTRLEAMGITMLPRPWQQPAESCDGVDPEGNVFQIVATSNWPQVSGTATGQVRAERPTSRMD
jgi:predicted enzyme related to lactoylglutathione lyase